MAEEKQNSWTNLNIKIDLDRCLTRMVLFEKYNQEKSKQIEMTDFFMEKINGCELFKHKEYEKHWSFYIKNGEILLQQDLKNKVFYIKYTDFWSVFSTKFGLNYADIQAFTKDRLEEGLKFDHYTTKMQPLAERMRVGGGSKI